MVRSAFFAAFLRDLRGKAFERFQTEKPVTLGKKKAPAVMAGAGTKLEAINLQRQRIRQAHPS
jgi:hypothetical protein